MELNAEHKINAPRDAVFAALNDPDILRQCIPGCESLDKASDTEMSATVVMKVGPVKAKFKGRVELSNLVPPESYSISGQGTGGAAGFAKGGADVRLVEDGAGTILHYVVKADVGGRLAQVGGRLIDSTAKALSERFFAKFGELVAGGDADIEAAIVTVDQADAASSGATRWGWIGISVAALVAVAAIIASNS